MNNGLGQLLLGLPVWPLEPCPWGHNESDSRRHATLELEVFRAVVVDEQSHRGVDETFVGFRLDVETQNGSNGSELGFVRAGLATHTGGECFANEVSESETLVLKSTPHGIYQLLVGFFFQFCHTLSP